MRTLTAKEAGHYVGRLEKIAGELENNWEDLGLSQKQALDFAYEVDAICDEIETTSRQAYERKAKLLSSPSLEAEPYLGEHFDSTPGWEGDADEAHYMDDFRYRPNGVHPTWQSGSVVQERTESPIQGLSDYSDGFKKQPSQPYVGGSPFPEKTSSLFKGGRYVKQTRG